MTVYINWGEETYYTDSAEVWAHDVQGNPDILEKAVRDYLFDLFDIDLIRFRNLAGDYFADWLMNIYEDERYIRYTDEWFSDFLAENYEILEIDSDEDYYIIWADNQVGTFEELTDNCDEDEIQYVKNNMMKMFEGA